MTIGGPSTPPLRTTLSSAPGALAGAPVSHPDCCPATAPVVAWRPPVDPVTWRTAVTHRARARESSRRAETAAPSRERLPHCSGAPHGRESGVVGSRGGGEHSQTGTRRMRDGGPPAWACIHGAPTHQRGPQRAVGCTRFRHACTPLHPTPPQIDKRKHHAILAGPEGSDDSPRWLLFVALVTGIRSLERLPRLPRLPGPSTRFSIGMSSNGC